jgi:hypothetical protein
MESNKLKVIQDVSTLPTPSFMPPAELVALPHEENQ